MMRPALRSARRLIVGSMFLLHATTTAQDPARLGEGSYHDGVPPGWDRPATGDGGPAMPRLAPGFTGPVPTSDWSSSIVFPRSSAGPHGTPMFPWPFSVQSTGSGLRLNGAPPLLPGNNGYFAYFDAASPDLVVRVAGLAAPDSRLADHGDWSVVIEQDDGARRMRSTITRGSPYLGIHWEGGPLELVLPSGGSVLEERPGEVVFNAGGRTYAAYASSADAWTIIGDTLQPPANAGGWIQLALLPDASPGSRELLRAHGLVEVLDTRVDWSYRPEDATVEVTYAFELRNRGTGPSRTLTGLLPHQRPHADVVPSGSGFETARGWMDLAAMDRFTLSIPAAPILPGLPSPPGLDREAIAGLLDSIVGESASITAPDSYWAGKQLGRVASAAQVADSIGRPDLRDQLLGRVRAELEDWLTIGTGPNPDRLEAESANVLGGAFPGPGEEGGTAILGLGGGDVLEFGQVDLGGRSPDRVLVRVASGAGPGGSALIRLRLDGPEGAVLSEAAVANTGGWEAWTTIPMDVSPLAAEALDGGRPLVFTCETGYPGPLLALDWIEWDFGTAEGPDKQLAYDPDWNTLIANPGSYGMATELNDHHFHYGYFIAAAATVARFDPDWAGPDRWGPMVDLLVRDAANWDRTDERFPFLRTFEPYAGHAYASGHAAFAAGNNQESSSESTHFAQAVVLWGEATGRPELRDLGLFLHSLETLSIEQYWFDADQSVYPAGTEHPLAGIVWDAGATYATWWTGNPEEIHGINLLPITGGSLYLGRRPDAMDRAWTHLLAMNGGPPVEWRDVLWAWRALIDPTEASAWLEAQSGWVSEAGHSRAYITHWIRSLAELGTVRHDLLADAPTAVAFERDGSVTYVAHNPSTVERAIVFADGVRVCVAPGATGIATADAPCRGGDPDLDGDGLVGGADLTLLLASWGTCSGDCPGDLDANGRVDGADLARLLVEWD